MPGILSTLVFGIAAASLEYSNEAQELAVAMMAQAPENEKGIKLGKYSTCPGAQYAVANIHTMAQMEVTFTNTCAEVQDEIVARASGTNGWQDPHNRGTYTMMSTNNNLISTKRRTGNKLFVDSQTFALTDTADGGCKAQMCSESQGTSANDGGTNMCDMFDLFCNSSEMNSQNGVSCQKVKNDLTYTIDSMDCGRYAFANNYVGHPCEDAQTTCLKVASDEHAQVLAKLEQPPKYELGIKLLKYDTCPGASSAFANIHTMAQMTVEFTNTCDEVAAEVEARAQMQNGWADPHNRGTYTLVSNNNNLISTQRRTGNKIFLDKQTFSLTSTGDGSSCTAQICSESQGTSANDGGTNLCDMFNLFCNSNDMNSQNGVSCKPIVNDLDYTVKSQECGRYAYQDLYVAHECQDAKTTCLKNPSRSSASLDRILKAIAN